MKKLLLIALLIVGCDNSTEPSYTTCYLDWTGGINTCTEELTERECYEYQEWTIVDSDGKEILIPVNDEIIQKVDFEKAEITVDLPEGLLDIYES